MNKELIKEVLEICNDDKRTDANKVVWIKEACLQAILNGAIK